jgi:hypothetical protein
MVSEQALPDGWRTGVYVQVRAPDGLEAKDPIA